MARPYIEQEDIRTFLAASPSAEFVWHRDREDRWIKSLDNTDWKFQLDNKPPTTLNKEKLFIPKETYHRLIKGTGDLKLKVIKVN